MENGTDGYRIDLLQLKEGVNEFDYKITGSFFDGEEGSPVLGADVDVRLDVEKRHGAYDFLFGFEGKLEVACDRCLDPVAVPIDTEYHLTVRHGEEYDDSRDELLVIPESDTKLDVSPLIHDTLLLSIPLRCVHPEGECNEEMAAMLKKHGGQEESGEEHEEDTNEN